MRTDDIRSKLAAMGPTGAVNFDVEAGGWGTVDAPVNRADVVRTWLSHFGFAVATVLSDLTFSSYQALSQKERDARWEKIRPEYQAAADAFFAQHPEADWVTMCRYPKGIIASGPMADYPAEATLEGWAKREDAVVFTLSSPIVVEEARVG